MPRPQREWHRPAAVHPPMRAVVALVLVCANLFASCAPPGRAAAIHTLSHLATAGRHSKPAGTDTPKPQASSDSPQGSLGRAPVFAWGARGRGGCPRVASRNALAWAVNVGRRWQRSCARHGQSAEWRRRQFYPAGRAWERARPALRDGRWRASVTACSKFRCFPGALWHAASPSDASRCPKLRTG